MKLIDKTKRSFILLLLVTILVLYFSLKDDFEGILNALIGVNVFWLFISILLMLGYWFLRSIPQYLFCKDFKDDYTFRQSFKLTLKTQFFNGVTPFASGGQPFEIYSLKKDGVPISKGTNVVIQNFIVYQIALILLGIFSIIYNHVFVIFPKNSLLKKLILVGFIVNLSVTTVTFMIAFLEKFNNFVIEFVIKILGKFKIVKNKEGKIDRLKIYTNNLHEGAKTLVSDKTRFIMMVFVNVIALMLQYLVPLFIMFGVGINDVPFFIDIIVASSYVMIMGAFVPMPGGTGGLEYGFVEFYKNFITGPSLMAIMLIWRFVTYYLGVIIGAIVLNIKERKS